MVLILKKRLKKWERGSDKILAVERNYQGLGLNSKNSKELVLDSETPFYYTFSIGFVDLSVFFSLDTILEKSLSPLNR